MGQLVTPQNTAVILQATARPTGIPRTPAIRLPNAAPTKNVGTITLLAVNPQSERLEDTLEYISVFCKYMMNKKDSFLLADEAMYTDTPFIREQYELYANGDINFRMDLEVYRGDFDDYICGRKELEETIKEVERKRKIYVGE